MSNYRRDQTAGGTFFFTVTLKDRHSQLLVEHVEHLRAVYRHVQQKYPFHTVAICILPDHLHAIWRLPKGDCNYPLRWSLIKSGFSRLLPPMERSTSNIARREKGIWQRRYWEHRIRDDKDLSRHVDYIHFNPVKHALASAVCDWPWSSFHRYVARGLLAAEWAGGDADENGVCGE